MMVRFSTLFIALVVAFTLVGFVQVPGASAAVFHHSYKGQVTSYDRTDRTLVVSGKKGEKAFDLSRAKMNGTIRPNEQVVVKYSNRDGKMVASSVKVERHARAGHHRGYGSQMDDSGDGSFNTPGSYR
jgi:hypothetical protein